MAMDEALDLDMNPIVSKRKTTTNNDYSVNSLKRPKETKFNEKEALKRDALFFILCDGGETSLFVSALMEFLTVGDVGRCEMVCRTFNSQTEHCWNQLDKVMIRGDRDHISALAKTARERVIHYHLASTLAKRIGNMGDSINKHLFVEHDNRVGNTSDERMNGGCKGCDFPDKWDFGLLQEESADNEYALFVRFSNTSDNTLLAEGFVNFITEYDSVNVELDHLNFSNWSQLMEISRLVVSNEGAFDDDDLLEECMSDLTATVVGVRKKEDNSFNVSLVFAQSGFGDGGIDNMGDLGYCWTKGHLRSRSHDPPLNIRQRKLYNGTNTNLHPQNEDNMEVNLGIFFAVLWTGEQDSNQNERIRCYWLLKCSYDKIIQ